MSSEKDKTFEKYAEDISTIKSLLLEIDEKPIIETWAFFTWGGCVLLGTVIHGILYYAYNIPLSSIFFIVWLPVFIVVSFLETTAWIRQMIKESIPFFAKPVVKVWLTALGAFIGLGFVIYVMIHVGRIEYIPGIVQLTFGIVFLIYAQISYSHLYIYGYFLILSAILLSVLAIPADILFIIVGILIGIAFIVSGIFMKIRDAQRNE